MNKTLFAFMVVLVLGVAASPIFSNISYAQTDVQRDEITNEVPDVVMTAEYLHDLGPFAVQFTCDSETGDGEFSVQWDFDNDEIIDSTSFNPIHIYDAAGDYVSTCTLIDSDRDTDSDSIRVTIPLEDIRDKRQDEIKDERQDYRVVPDLVLTSPTGKVLTAGSTIPITWSGGNPSWSVLISLIDIEEWAVAQTIVSSTPNDGFYRYTIPTTLPFEGQCGHEYQFYIDNAQKTHWNYGPTFTIEC